ncbi:MAG: amino acid racemase [Sphingobacteriales bacterium JAD_PAG50586_3]|nr:MAG: amino acid racemase [Sphingobacteriales bacterium JAD_PAG50586_3]
MKKLGLLGGISWVSTIDYYRAINQGINKQLGDLNFAECIIYSLNYQEIKENNDKNDWDANFELALDACLHLKISGAEALVLCANTMHLLADRIEDAVGLPVIHIATATAEAIARKGLRKVALLGTKVTMERGFYQQKLDGFNIEAIIPNDDDRAFIHYTIFEELGRDVILESSKQRYLRIIEDMIAQGAEGIILGCTEIPLLIKPEDVSVPVFDTALIHSDAAVKFALS